MLFLKFCYNLDETFVEVIHVYKNNDIGTKAQNTHAPHIYHSFNINPPAPICPRPRFTSKLKHACDRNAASYRGAFRFACVQDYGCRGTSRGGTLSVLLMQEERGTVGFGAFGGGVGFAFLWGCEINEMG